MSYGYRFGAWVLEMLSEAALFTCIAIWMVGADDPVAGHSVTARDIAAFMTETLVFFCISGYAVTTLACRLALRGRWLRMYPAIAAFLFLAHLEIVNLLAAPEGFMDPHNRFIFRVIGSGVVMIVAAVISLALERIGRKFLPSKARNV